MTARKPSGRNIPEAQRSTVQVKLRLPPDVAEDLDELASRWDVTRSGAVARLLEELDGGRWYLTGETTDGKPLRPFVVSSDSPLVAKRKT